MDWWTKAISYANQRFSKHGTPCVKNRGSRYQVGLIQGDRFLIVGEGNSWKEAIENAETRADGYYLLAEPAE